MTTRNAIRNGLRTTALALVLGLSALAPVSGPHPAHAEEQLLNYRDADIRAFIDDVSMLTSKTFIVDPRVQGKVTVISNTRINGDSLFEVFLATLRVNGYSVVSMPSGAYKILPNEAAVQDASPIGEKLSGDRFVTEVFKLNYVDGLTIQNMLKAVVNSDGRVVSHRASDVVVVVDYASNMNRIRQVIGDIDKDTSILKAVGLANTPAVEMARIISSLAEKQPGEDGASLGISAVAIEGTNTVVLKGEAPAVKRMVSFVEELDAGNVTRKRDVRVIPLKYAEAEDLVPLLQEVSASIVKAKGEDAKAAISPDAKVHIGFHKGTNALVINADAEMQAIMTSVVSQLDVRRSQVVVEAIVVEVSDAAARELGLQYILSGGDGDSKIPFTATNFSNSAPNILAATGAVVATSDSDDEELVSQLQQAAIDSLLGVSGFLGGVAGQTGDGTIFGVILNALQQDTESNVLSTPHITTIDNEPASIMVGQEIPITTGEVIGDNFQNPFRTVERQDVGIQLDVTPQITQDGIRLEIRQEVSSILGPVTANSSELILNKRELKTSALADDGEIIVLGGLIQRDEQIQVDKVPFLGDVPVLGSLFRSKARSKSKTNLMVFLRPTIVRTREDMAAAVQHSQGIMRDAQAEFGAIGDTTIDQFMAETLHNYEAGNR